MKHLLVVSVILACAPISIARADSNQTSGTCFNTAESDAAVQLEGRLAAAASIDAYGKEPFYLLKLRRPICIDDGGEFADPSAYFSEVQVAGTDHATWRAIRKSIGRIVKLSGTAFAAHTAHHHRPMVVLANSVLPLSR